MQPMGGYDLKPVEKNFHGVAGLSTSSPYVLHVMSSSCYQNVRLLDRAQFRVDAFRDACSMSDRGRTIMESEWLSNFVNYGL